MMATMGFSEQEKGREIESSLPNAIVIATFNMGAKILLALSSSSSNSSKGKVEGEWKVFDHIRYLLMLMVWLILWVFRLLLDHFPSPLPGSWYLENIVQTSPALPGTEEEINSNLNGCSGRAIGRALSQVLSEYMPPFAKSRGHYQDTEAFFPPKISCLNTAMFVGDPSDATWLLFEKLFTCSVMPIILRLWKPNDYGQLPMNEKWGLNSYVLALVNDIPVTSRKYEFARGLADKIIEDNANLGEPALKEINRMALSAGFARTLKLLNSSLHGMQRQQQDVETCSWTWRLVRMIPLYSQLMPSFDSLRGSLANMLQPQPSPTLSAFRTQTMMANNNSVLAEKLAQELLWMTNKLGMCLAMEEAILQWSSANSLATISISAHPRVQGSLVKISVFLFKEMAMGSLDISEQVRFKLLILWLPLFCYALNGVDSPVLSALEKVEVERVLEKTISSLSELDQEVVLANWLHDYAFSSSDWPNLQNCYDAWCHASRKLI
eukprot:Gb_30597 [translate_table: standard]